MTQEALALWFVGFCCLMGEVDIDYRLPETDPDWWELYLWKKRN